MNTDTDRKPDFRASNTKLILKEETRQIIGCAFEVLNGIGHERGQMTNYLRITKLRVGLILNFKHAKLEWDRVVL